MSTIAKSRTAPSHKRSARSRAKGACAGALTLTALLGAGLFAPTGARADNGDVAYNISGDYSYKIVNVPDLDQRRAAKPGVVGLSNNGSQYCVPTACMNLLGYIANH